MDKSNPSLNPSPLNGEGLQYDADAQDDEPMTQEELFVELEQAFFADTGIMTIPTRLSDFIDLYAEDDDEHWQFVEFFMWTLRNYKDVNRE